MTTDNNNIVPEQDEEEEHQAECLNCGNSIDIEYDSYATNFPMGYPQRARMALPPDAQVVFCEDCFVTCNDCDEAIFGGHEYRVDTGGWDPVTVCRYCHDDYVSCAECGYTARSDYMQYCSEDDASYCSSCYDDMTSAGQHVHSYSWQPSDRLFWYTALRPEQNHNREFVIPIKFAGLRAFGNLDAWQYQRAPFDKPEDYDGVKNQLFMGYELETNRGECRDVRSAAEYLLNAMRKTDEHGVTLQSEDYLYLKEDGSISGFEIVTMPATLEAHKVLMPRDAFAGLAKDHGMQGWAGAGAGLHVHASKSAFSHAHLHKFQLFHYRNQHWLKSFAGRDSGRWASFDQTTDHNGQRVKLSSLAKGTYERTYLNRYHALNFVPPRTVELRYFRASLKPDTVLAVLEIVHAIWLYTKQHNSSDYRNNGFAWSNFRSWVADQDYEFLVPVMDKRGV